MAQGLEADAVEEWIYATLKGDSTLMALLASAEVWNGGTAPQGTPYPFLTIQHMSGIDLVEVASNRIWTNLVYLIKVVGESADYQTLRAAVARIDTLLHRASGTAADGTVWACVREQTIRMPEILDGKQYRNDGFMFRIYAS
jgi:hypothetical protein